MDLEERFVRVVGVEHCDNLPVQLPQRDDLFELHAKDVLVDVPAPVIPAQYIPRIIMTIIMKRHFAQKFANAPVIFLGLIGALCWFHGGYYRHKREALPIAGEFFHWSSGQVIDDGLPWAAKR
jgi:hypothetical protein